MLREKIEVWRVHRLADTVMKTKNTETKQLVLLCLCSAMLTGSVVAADKATKEHSSTGGRAEKSANGGRSEKSGTGSGSEKSSREIASKEKPASAEKSRGMTESQKADRQAIDREIARDKEAKHAEAMRDKSHDNRVKVGEGTSIGVGGSPAGPGIDIKHTFGPGKKDR